MGTERLGVLVFGTNFGVTTHVRALRDAGFTVLGLVGQDQLRTRQQADLTGVPHAFTDADEALALPGAGTVTIATPPHTHAPLVIKAAEAGKHVWCEKPFALTLTQATAMVSAAERARVVTGFGTELRFERPQALLRRVVAAGAIGEPRSAMFVRQLPLHLDPLVPLQAWWQDAACGGGWLGAFGSHVVDQIRTTLGEFAGLSASLQTLAPRQGMSADDTYTVHFRLTGGCTGVMHSSSAIGGLPVSVTKITGTRGSAWLDGSGAPQLQAVWTDTGSGPQRVPDPDDLPTPPPGSPQAAIRNLVPCTRAFRQLRARILGEQVRDDPPLATFADGLANQRVLDAIRESAETMTWVDVDNSPG
jgi:predicted dehydrogenase